MFSFPLIRTLDSTSPSISNIQHPPNSQRSHHQRFPRQFNSHHFFPLFSAFSSSKSFWHIRNGRFQMFCRKFLSKYDEKCEFETRTWNDDDDEKSHQVKPGMFRMCWCFLVAHNANQMEEIMFIPVSDLRQIQRLIDDVGELGNMSTKFHSFGTPSCSA